MLDFSSLGIQIVTLLCVLIGGIYLYFRHAYQHWAKLGVEYLEPTFPFGNMKDNILAKRDLGNLVKDFHNQIKGEYGGIYMFARPTLVIKSREMLKKILIKDFDHFVDRGIYVDEKKDPVSAGLFSINGQKWRTMRNKMSPAFTSGKLKMMFNTITEQGKCLEKYLEKTVGQGEKEFEIKDLSSRFLTDLIASVAFGIEIDSLNDPETMFRVMGEKSVQTNWKVFITFLVTIMIPSLAKTVTFKQTPDDVEKFMLDMVKQTIEYREKNGVTREDFMQIMIQLRNGIDIGQDDISLNTKISSGGLKKMSLEEITAQCFIFFVAGFETSSTVMSYCLFELSKHPEILREVQKEIDTVLMKHGGKITYESLSEMKKLDTCIDETQRIYPPVSVLMRICTKDYKIPDTNILIKEGTNVFISALGIHNDPEIYPEPEKFDPTRFEPENKKNLSTVDYLPFGDGPRNCVGMRLGKLNSKVGLISLLSKYDFNLGDKQSETLVMDPKNFVLFPEKGIKLKIFKRKI